MQPRAISVAAILLAASLTLTACGSSNTSTDATNSASAGTSANPSQEASATTVTIEDNRGSVTVPVPATSVIATDNRIFQTLEAWGVKLAAAPQDIMASTSAYKTDTSIVNLGNHREPDLEAVVAVNPDLIINGQRFQDYYDDFTSLVPDAAIVDLDVRDGEPFDEELRRQVRTLGEIFGKQSEADALIKAFDDSIARVKAAYKPDQKVMAVIVSGGKINYSAPSTGRTLGPVFDILGLTPAISNEGSTDHQGDEISVETIAQANPDWLLVMDRDAAVGASESQTPVPAKEVISDSSVMANVTAVSKQQVVYMPSDTYVNESIQTYTKFFNDLAEVMESQA